MAKQAQSPDHDHNGTAHARPQPKNNMLETAVVTPAPSLLQTTADPHTLTPAHARILQRTLGNQAVGRLVAGSQPNAASAPFTQPPSPPQREAPPQATAVTHTDPFFRQTTTAAPIQRAHDPAFNEWSKQQAQERMDNAETEASLLTYQLLIALGQYTKEKYQARFGDFLGGLLTSAPSGKSLAKIPQIIAQAKNRDTKEALEETFRSLTGGSLRATLRDIMGFSDDYVRAYAYLRHNTLSHEHIAMGLALIPIGTRDTEVLRLLTDRPFSARKALESSYNYTFGDVGKTQPDTPEKPPHRRYVQFCGLRARRLPKSHRPAGTPRLDGGR